MDRVGTQKKVERVIQAFDRDGYRVDPESGVFYYSTVEPGSQSFAVMAEHTTAQVDNTGKMKKVFYLEGTPRQMGYMLGYLDEPDVSLMSGKYVDNFIWAFMKFGLTRRSYPHGRGWRILIGMILKFIDWLLSSLWKLLCSILPSLRKLAKITDQLVKFITKFIDRIIVIILDAYTSGKKQDIPTEYLDEIQGIYDGCKAVNPKTKVSLPNLLTLNIGIDCILSLTYRGIDLVQQNPDIKPEMFKIPIMCNGFSVTGDAVEGDNHYMGRDFMFPTAGAFQDAACMIIYKPHKENALPIVSVTAPGIVGTIAALNAEGVAIGVDISPSGWVNTKEPGLNSLLLCRQAVQYGPTIDEAVQQIHSAKRGVSWDYILSDGKTGRSCIVESVRAYDTETAKSIPDSFHQFDHKALDIPQLSKEVIDGVPLQQKAKEALDYIQEQYPDIGQAVIENNGILVRWADYTYPETYLDSNPTLFDMFQKTMRPDAMGETGFINRYTIAKGIQQNTPYTFYFAPQRETLKDVVVVTNFFIYPDMRYTVMNAWLARMFRFQTDDFQWRYDTLNSLILEAIEEQKITYTKARELIDFLNPKGDYPWYYGRKAKIIEGSLSLFDLKNRTIESHYGYYGDQWIKISLMNYL